MGIRWDRISRIGLLFVMAFVLFLYVSPARSYVSTWRESQTRAGEVKVLEAEHRRLKVRRQQLTDPRALEREARALGMVKPGEKSFVIKGLPRG